MDTLKIEDCQGRRVYRAILSPELYGPYFKAIQHELCRFVYGEYASMLWERFEERSLAACIDSEIQVKYGIPQHVTRKKANTREHKILIKTGSTQFYSSPIMRLMVYENKIIYDAIKSFYGPNTNLTYINGPDEMIVKPYNSEDSPITFDCEVLENLGKPGSASKNPFHYYAFFCAASSYKCTDEFDDGGLCILENFDLYYEFLRLEFGARGKLPLEKQPKNIGRKTHIKALNLDLINDIISHKYGVNAPKVKWVNLDLRAGDLALIDCRIPYRFCRNKNEIPTIYTQVSLEPRSIGWEGSPRQNFLRQFLRAGKVGDWNKDAHRGTNNDEYLWRRDSTGIDSLDAVIVKGPFNVHQACIYGMNASSI